MVGLSDKSDVKELTVEENGTVKKYTIKEKTIDVSKLQSDLEYWQNMKEPTDKELIELGKSLHEYYIERDREIERLNKLIKEANG